MRKLLRHPLRRAAARRGAGAGVRRAASPDAGSHRALPCPPFALARVLAHWANDDASRSMKQEAGGVDPPPRDSDESSGEDRGETTEAATVADNHAAFPAVNKRR